MAVPLRKCLLTERENHGFCYICQSVNFGKMHVQQKFLECCTEIFENIYTSKDFLTNNLQKIWLYFEVSPGIFFPDIILIVK